MAHTPVLLNKVLEILAPATGQFIIDGTMDGGGHAALIIKRITPHGTFLGVDLDREMIAEAKKKFRSDKGVDINLVESNYANIPAILKNKKLGKADGLLLDLGFSSNQLESGRGFSFRKDEPLLMAYDRDGQTAAEVVNGLSEKELADIFYTYGEERRSRQIAKRIVEARKKKRIMTTGELAEVVRGTVGKSYEGGRIDPSTRVFQALRIYVNRELENLSQVLAELKDILRSGGIAAIISFHSLEDRLVKQAFKQMERDGVAEILTKKPITADLEEQRDNPRSRSAKLRAIVMK
ncbi:MAG: 16S rRNA (cytosine(1402)-N(4))-methyltransferase RsmH [Patescibacteria group bacterium]